MRVLGMMSGTSADGIDAALARISGAPPALPRSSKDIFTFRSLRYVREAILRLAMAQRRTTAEISELNFLLGEEFAAAAIAGVQAVAGAAGKTVADRFARADDFSSGRGSRFHGRAASLPLCKSANLA